MNAVYTSIPDVGVGELVAGEELAAVVLEGLLKFGGKLRKGLRGQLRFDLLLFFLVLFVKHRHAL